MATVVKDLGAVTAYAYAVAGGYSGTEAEFEALLGNIAEDLSEIENLSVTVTTLPAGSSATASYSNGVLSLGIPKGDKGDKGDKGNTGDTGATGPQGLPGDVANLAAAYSDSSTYNVGDYCIYNNQLYRCTTAITTAETWTAAHWTAAVIGNDVSDLKNAVELEFENIINGTNDYTPTLGDYDGSKFVTSTNRAYLLFDLGTIKTISVNNGLQFTPEVNSNGVGSAFTVVRSWSSNDYDASTRSEKYLLIMVRKNSSNDDLSSSDLENAITITYKESLHSLRDDMTTAQTDTDVLQSISGYEWTSGYYVYADGGVTTANDRACTDFIPCNPGMSITYIGENNNSNVCGLAFYDGNFKFISGDKNSGTLGDPITVTSPANTAYMRVSTKLSILNISKIIFNGFKNTPLISIAQRALNFPVYVDSVNGSDITGDGRNTNAYKTIAHALSIGARKIALVPGGSYNEVVNVDGGDIFLFAGKVYWNNSRPNRLRAVIDGDGTTETALIIQNAKNVVLEDIEVCNCTGDGCKLDGCGAVQLVNCSFHDNGNNGIVIDYTNGVIRHCVAYNNAHDGFNMNYYGDTQFYDCSGWNNDDDGISHHQGCTGVINGGEWYGNTKGGVASPANGALVDILNVYCHDNAYGIWANADDGTEARTFRAWNCVLTDNTNYGITSSRNTALCYNCKISGNTSGQTSGNVTVLD